MRVENGVLIERESREFQPHFLAQNLTKILIFEGVKQEEFDALKNGDFYCDYGSEFYSAGETKNLCYSRVNSEWRAVQCYTNDVQRNERSCSDLCRAFTLKLRQFPWLFTG